VNPHRLNLGTIGLNLRDRQGQPVSWQSLQAIRQEQKLWDGEIVSAFTADGERVEVTTGVHPAKDALFARIKSRLLKDQRASLALRFSYPTGRHADDANDWTRPDLHASLLKESGTNHVVIKRVVGSTQYYVTLRWEGNAVFTERAPHEFVLSTKDDVLTFEAEYSLEAPSGAVEGAFIYDQALKATIKHWNRWWQEGAIVDFSQCTDPRAKELERRVVLSQYLTQINCANALPPQETGLTYNSWFGRPHLEMAWWHLVSSQTHVLGIPSWARVSGQNLGKTILQISFPFLDLLIPPSLLLS
jgi:hypothetical protein